MDKTLPSNVKWEDDVGTIETSSPSRPNFGSTVSMKKAAVAGGGLMNNLTKVAGNTVAAVSGSPSTFGAHRSNFVPGVKSKGIFHREENGQFEAAAGRHGKEAGAHSVDFRQHLELLLSSEENARNVGRKLYERFEGDTARLPSVLKLLEEKWGFPNSVFTQLYTHLRRAARQADDPDHVDIDEWAEAFFRWLQSLKALSSRTKVTRQCLIHARSGNYLQDTYLQAGKLGEGTFGEVFAMLHKALGVARVVKIVSKTQLGMASEAIDQEVTLLKSLDHPHIIRIFETFETEEDLSIIMDYAEGGDLAQVIKENQASDLLLSEVWVRIAADQIASALEYMHSRAVIHCDLKPANVMLLRPYDPEVRETPHTLLVDFGLAEIFEERSNGERARVKGTPLYLSPEGFDGHLTQKSDMWAVGAMVFEMLIGRRPFKEHKSLFVLWSCIAKTEPNLDELPALAGDLVRALLSKDPKLRPTAKECRLMEWFVLEAHGDRSEVQDAPKCKPLELGHLNYFHRSAMFCIAAGLSMKEMRHLYEVFQSLDKDKTGYLSMDELTQGLAVLGSESDPKTLMAVMDMDQSGHISYTEFLAGALRADEDLNDRLLQYAFDMFDLDGDKFISMHELKLMLSGDGPLVDVLPDGHTVSQVMDELGEGEGRVTFEQFRKYMGNVKSKESSMPRRKEDADEGPQNTVAMLIRDLDHEEDDVKGGGDDAKQVDAFPAFHAWLADLLAETHEGAEFGCLLTFGDKALEASYVAHELALTCRQVSLLCFILFVYSMWALTTSGFKWEPSLGKWGDEVLIAHNLGWLSLAMSAVIVGWGSLIQSRGAGWSRDDAVNHARDAQAVNFEIRVCIWACFVPWVSCFFANRFRVAALFGADASDVFTSKNSDYDLILAMLGTLTFFSTRTNVRFACVLTISINCVLAYVFSSIMFGISKSGCDENEKWLWPGMMLTLLIGLVLSGHRAVEYHRRMTFLGFYHSYLAIKEMQEEDPAALQVVQSSTEGTKVRGESKLRRFKTAMEVLTRFYETKELGSPPVRAAMRNLKLVVQEVHDDIVAADEWIATDVRGALQMHGVTGATREAILSLFGDNDGTVIQEARPEAAGLALDALRTHASEPEIAPMLPPQTSFVLAPWGWDAFSGSGSPLLEASEAVFIPTVSSDLGVDAVPRARVLFELLLRSFKRSEKRAEVRAALALYAAHWFAQELQLWDSMQPVERIALLVSAVGVHCQGGAALFTTESLLARSAAATLTVDALDESRLIVDGNALHLRQLVCRAIIRSRPGCMLEDAKALRVQVNQHGHLSAASANRSLMISVVASMASYSFLALPSKEHEPWALLCQEEAAAADQAMKQSSESAKDPAEALDVACWLRALIEVLMLPMCETLSVFDGVGSRITEPQDCLHANSKFWKNTKLAATRRSSQMEPPLGQLDEMDRVECDPKRDIQMLDDHLLTQRPPEDPPGLLPGQVG